MSYPLTRLLDVRRLRERMAYKNLIKAKNALEVARQKVIEQEKKLKEFKEFRKKEEKRLYDAILNKKIKKIDVDELRSEIASLKQRELDHEKAVQDAKDEKEKAKEVVEEARAFYNGAVINVMKIQEHKDRWMQVWSKEEEVKEERELEEFQRIKEEVEF